MKRRALDACGAVLAAVAVLALAGCEVAVGGLAGRAQDEWVRAYTLPAGGSLTVGNTNGRIEVEGTDGASVEVRAERIAKATSDGAARELLERIPISETVNADGVALETGKLGGMLIGASFEVRYHVKVPKATPVKLRNTNGVISMVALSGKVDATTTNGAVNGRDLSGAVDARTTNGGVNIDISTLHADGVRVQTTNGGVQLALPDGAKASVKASVTNGGIDASGLKMAVSEQSKRRFEGSMNGGGAPVEASTTNGGVRLRSRASARSDS